ncbi:MAG: hypothetical protein ACI3ZZ_00420 [Candidatus Aphodosoma sp.]
MLDTDQRMVVIDEKGTPLSPFEMRDKYIKGEHFTLMVNYTEPMDIMDYYTSYMAKNTYWFASPAYYSDTKQNCLVPKGMTQWGYKGNFITTESELRFTKE